MKITTAAADRSVNNLNDRLARLWPDDDKRDDGINYWKGKPIIPVEEWKKIAIPSVYEGVLNPMVFVSDRLQSFPDGLVEAALLLEGHSVDAYDETIYPYHDGDPRPGTEEWEREFMWSLRPKRELSDAELKLWQTRLEERQAKAKKEDPFEIWIEEYK